VKYILILAAFILTSCTNAENSRRILEDAGYTGVEIKGYSVFGCSDDDVYHDKFTAISAAGRPVTGVVCGGYLFKGATIRLN
jgi:hypothetical protein